MHSSEIRQHHQISQDHPGYRNLFQGSKEGSNINFQKPLKIC